MELQTHIQFLANKAKINEAEFIRELQDAPDEVVAGVILYWKGKGGLMGGPDPGEPGRQAAKAILDARASRKMIEATYKLHETISTYQEESGRQTKRLLGLTVAIVILTIIMLLGIAAQIWIAAK